ncbi:TPA: hypothetical protein OWX15_002654 [Staphylococcus aureus]|nr:hypothetical protein [Staphylococcus aureus]MBH4791606.1 hypothetical protein [Staphylococcus aureus]MBH4824901.1 hypothetical protein [Staphylococcus aureus]MBY0808789.1 hypothetical protein [Staphylococcus aureus]HBH8924913.1 hypothetical protein [Staphylococcus aureus]
MTVSEGQKQKLSEKIEEVIQSTNFGSVLATTDAYLYEQMVIDAFEQNDMPNDIEPQDVNHELTLTNKTNTESWTELLIREDIHSDETLKSYLDNEEDLAQLMLNHIENNFDATVEIKEELSEVRDRKPDVKTLSDALELAYDENTFIEYLKEEETDKFNEKVRETAADEGIPYDMTIDEIPYTAYISLKTDFDSLAEKYIEEAKESESTSMYAQENINKLLVQGGFYELDIEVDKDQLAEV